MRLADVMGALGDALAEIDGLRVYSYPPESVAVPAGIIAYPDEIDFNASYQRGMDTMTIPIVVAIGKVSDRASVALMAEYASGSGDKSIKAVVDGHDYGDACDSVTVTSASFDTFVMGGVDYIAATFMVDIVGSGS